MSCNSESTLSSTRTTIVNYWTTISLKHARKKYNVIAFLSKKIFFTTLCSLLQLASLKSRHSFHSNGKFGKPKTSPLSILKWNPPISLTLSLPCQLALIDFTLSNARRFYSSMGNPLGVKGQFLSEPRCGLPFHSRGVPHWRVKSSGISKIKWHLRKWRGYNLNCWHSDINKIIMISIVQTFLLSWLSWVLMKLIPKIKSYTRIY